jgi:membrane protease YdiL (CAAX protease family)
MPGLPALGWVAVLVLALMVNGYGEETGWRGFAWPRLRQRHTLTGAALLLAVPWALWHLPTFWLDTGLRGFPLLMLLGFLVGMAAGAGGARLAVRAAHSSVLIVALFHACLNMASATRGTEGAGRRRGLDRGHRLGRGHPARTWPAGCSATCCTPLSPGPNSLWC